MSLTGREHFYDAWHELVVATVSNAPVLDLGTSQPYRKEMSILRGHVPTPYCCLDVAGSKAVDREDLIEVRQRTIHEAIAFDASNSAFELRAEHLVQPSPSVMRITGRSSRSPKESATRW